ncbi:MAG: hypothetical protein KDA99_02090 [Planctomycetales bacterium]|nr:hypothetical protein [Planctomycetales bacterium]
MSANPRSKDALAPRRLNQFTGPAAWAQGELLIGVTHYPPSMLRLRNAGGQDFIFLSVYLCVDDITCVDWLPNGGSELSTSIVMAESLCHCRGAAAETQQPFL